MWKQHLSLQSSSIYSSKCSIKCHITFQHCKSPISINFVAWLTTYPFMTIIKSQDLGDLANHQPHSSKWTLPKELIHLTKEIWQFSRGSSLLTHIQLFKWVELSYPSCKSFSKGMLTQEAATSCSLKSQPPDADWSFSHQMLNNCHQMQNISTSISWGTCTWHLFLYLARELVQWWTQSEMSSPGRTCPTCLLRSSYHLKLVLHTWVMSNPDRSLSWDVMSSHLSNE